ncbi:achaete-scute homolog 3 [Protopterus annectens]|uniref:achaete-scute homolog 3 n=1 Tax=Protopterus annectens TaxID=7888 RepID=UPI001CFAB7D1|nr:achaete-scute homolog 3 [Protopterus annectens]
MMDTEHFSGMLEKMPFTDSSGLQLLLPVSVEPAVVGHHSYLELPPVSNTDDLIAMTFPPDQPLYPDCVYGDPYSQVLPLQVAFPAYGNYSYYCEPAFIRKRNERERQRVKCVNEGYDKLRHHLPKEYVEKRLSKVETLRAAIKYIKHLQSVLCSDVADQKTCRLDDNTLSKEFKAHSQAKEPATRKKEL